MRKKKGLKGLIAISLSATMILSTGSLAYANIQALPNGRFTSQDGMTYLTDSKGEKYCGWFIDSEEDWYYFNESDKAMKTGWHHDAEDGYWYYMDLSDGKMETGWQTIDGKEYFFQPVRDMGNYHFNNEQEKWLYSINSNVPYGAMYVDTTTPDGSKVDSMGVKVVTETTTQTVNNNSSSDTETVKNGWVSENGSWHYYENGTLARNKWLNLDGKWYYVTGDGAMVSNGWKTIGGKSYFFGADGGMYVNTTTPDGKRVDENGIKIVVDYSSYVGLYITEFEYKRYLASNEKSIEDYMSGTIMPYIRIDSISNGSIEGYYDDGSSGAGTETSGTIRTSITEDGSFSYFFEGEDYSTKSLLTLDAKFKLEKKAGKNIITEYTEFRNDYWKENPMISTDTYCKVK